MKDNQRRFGHLVTFDEDNLTLTIHGPYDYEIDVEDWTDSAQVLDWIFQIERKTWCSAEMLHQFIQAIQEICHIRFDKGAQGVFCPFGQNQKVKWN